jgi:periplasmic copper chaperone A
MRRVARLLSCLAAVSTAFLVLAASAYAHVTVSAVNATQGADTVLTFQVPTESDTASTVGVTVQLPDAPLAQVLDQPLPGWTFSSQTKRLATPITTDDGTVTEAISEVGWKATGAGIKPGQFGQFVLSVGPLPKVASMTFKVIQSYSDGTQVAWIEVAAPGSNAEPEHPAPVLTLSPASTSAQPAAGGSTVTAEPKKQSQTGPVVLGVVALVVAVAAATVAGLAFVRSRRQTGERT